MKKTLIFSHRGANREAAENTRSAFDKALLRDIDGIETDVQLCRDGVAVLWHDDFLDKLGLPGQRIDDYDFAQLQQMNFAAHFAGSAKPESLLSLQQFLQDYRKRCRLLLEIKSSPTEPVFRKQLKVEQTLQLSGKFSTHPNEAMLISSFDPGSLIEAHRLAPGFPLIYNIEPEQTLAQAQQALTLYPFLHGLCLPIASLDSQRIELLRAHKKCIAVYTCNSDQEIGHALSLGCDILISDLPDKALQLRNR